MAAITPPFTTIQLFAGLTVLAIGSSAVVAAHSCKHLPNADAIVPVGA